jgi:hypothetical protein
MTDEEFLKQDLSMLEEELDQELEPQATDQIDESEEEQTSDDETNEDAIQETETSESNTDESEEDESDDEVTDTQEDTLEKDEPAEDNTDPESQDTDVLTNVKKADTDGDTQETAKTDFEGAYKRIMAPFKASKRMMQVDNVDDAIKLMQMGADYNHKMQSVRPNLKIVSMLEKEGLLDAEKLNNLIDLSKKNPQAIAKLVKESGIDPLDIDIDDGEQYKPTNYSVTDKEFKINQAIDDIKDTDSFDRTLNVLSKEWDNDSKKLVSDNPEIIGIINEHVSNGVYDKVQEIVDKERALGRLNVPDVVAYKQVAEYLQSNGTLVGQGHVNTPPPASVPKTKANEVDTAKLQQKRKAAGSTKKTASKNTSSTPDYLKMTDDEFMRMAASS